MLSASTVPTVYHCHQLPRKTPTYRLTFRFGSGTVGLSKALFEMISQTGSPARMAMIHHGNGWYLTRPKTGGFTVSLTTSGKSGKGGGTVYRKALTELIRQTLCCGPLDSLIVNVTRTPVEVEGLDKEQYPNPVYRLLF